MLRGRLTLSQVRVRRCAQGPADARPAARLASDQPAARHIPGAGRGGPHAGHGFRAADQEDRGADPPGPPDADVVRHLAQGRADHLPRVPHRRLQGANRVFGAEGEPHDPADCGGGAGAREVPQADQAAGAGAQPVHARPRQDAHLCGDKAQLRQRDAHAAHGRLARARHPRRQEPAGARLGAAGKRPPLLPPKPGPLH
eukprot:1184279-Prorocentrum_minimum.AAC.1